MLLGGIEGGVVLAIVVDTNEVMGACAAQRQRGERKKKTLLILQDRDIIISR